MAASVVDTSFWIKFFSDAGIPSLEATAYAIKFTDNRIQKTMLLDLNKDYLNDMGIGCLGDIIAILKHAKAFHDKILRERTLEKIDGPPDAVKIAAVAAATRQIAPSSTPAAAVAALPQQQSAAAAAARIQAAAAPVERPPRAAAVVATATAAKRSSSTAAALAAVVPRQPAVGASATSARKAAGYSGVHAGRVSGVPSSASGKPEVVSDQDDDYLDGQSADDTPPRPHRAVLPPRKRPSSGSGPASHAKKRLSVTDESSPSSSRAAVAVSTKSRTASASVESNLVAARSSQASIFSRLGSSGDRATVAADEPRVTVTGLGKARLLSKPDTSKPVVRLKRPVSGIDTTNGTRKSGAPSDDAKAAARMLIATARSATASTAASRPARLTGDPEGADVAAGEPKKCIIALRTVVTGGQRAAVGSMTADSSLLRQDVKQRLGLSVGDGPTARRGGESGVPSARTGAARIASARRSSATATGEPGAGRAGSQKRSAVVGVLSRVGGAASGTALAGSGSTARLLTSSDDLRKRIGSLPADATTASAVGGDGASRQMARGSVFSRLGGL